MQGKIIKVAMLAALLGVILALLSACGGGVAQEDYDAAKQQLATKEQEAAAAKQEAAAAKQQVASLQEQLKPPAAQKPGRQEATITIDMGESANDMFFETPEGQKGGPFTLPSGKTVGIHFVNNGKKLHEFIIGRGMKFVDGKPDGFEVNLLEKVVSDVFVYPSGSKIEVAGAAFEEAEVGPAADLWIRTKFPAELKGEWEIACIVQEPNAKGHYEQGMKAKLIIQ